MMYKSGWQPIETIPKTLDKYPVLSQYGKKLYLVEGLNAFNEPCSDGTHFFKWWLDVPEPPDNILDHF